MTHRGLQRSELPLPSKNGQPLPPHGGVGTVPGHAGHRQLGTKTRRGPQAPVCSCSSLPPPPLGPACPPTVSTSWCPPQPGESARSLHSLSRAGPLLRAGCLPPLPLLAAEGSVLPAACVPAAWGCPVGSNHVLHIPMPCFDRGLWQGTEGGWRDALFVAAAWARALHILGLCR